MPGLQQKIESASLPALTRMAQLPLWVPIVAVLLLLAASFLVGPFGWVLTAVVALFLTWMLVVSWPTLTGVERLMRLAVLFLVVAVALVQALPR